MSKLRKIIQTVIVASLFSAVLVPQAWARTAIGSFGVHVKTNLEAGDTLPDMNVGNNGDTNYVYSNSSKYDILDVEWSSSTEKELKIGETPKMKIYLEGVDDYYFRNSYSSGNVSVSGADFVSAKVSNGQMVLTVKARPVKGEFDPPADAYWSGSRGQAKWEAPDEKYASSGAYDVYLYRGGTLVKKLENYKRTSADFYPYMTRKGTYTFRVRTVPSTSKEEDYGKKSGWTKSDELYIDEHQVSDGSGQISEDNSSTTNSGGITSVGWQKLNGTWSFRYPDGSYHRNGWLSVDGRWYLFDSNGAMLTGWQKVNNIWYYLSTNEGGPYGAMHVGWLKEGNAWYYFNPNQGGPEGAMCTNSWIQVNGKTYYVNPSGIMAEGWNDVGGQWHYFYPGSGEMAVNTVIDGFPVDSQGVWNRNIMTR